jgi:3-hydroxyacyl-[acyl-carrier-protein] dehydratase
MNLQKVKDFIPHRHPFLFVDTIESVRSPHDLSDVSDLQIKHLVETEVVGYYKTKPDHPIFAGHFPGNPIFPGVLQIEMMAQISIFAMTLLAKGDFKDYEMDCALISTDYSKFRKPILPNMNLRIEVKLVRSRGPFLNYVGKTYHNGEVMSEVDFKARFVIRKKD